MKYALLWIAIGMLLGCVLSECTRTPCPAVIIDTVRTADTIFLQEKVTKKPYKPTPFKVIPAGIPAHAQLHADSSIKSPAAYIYQDSLVDSNLAIYINDTTAGPILGRGISYTLKVPLQIKETITITKTAEVPVLQHGLFIGAEIGTNLQMFRIAPEIEYLTKKGYAYSYNYDVINNLHSVGIKRKLEF
jgi:hypothetical protein